MYSMINDCHDCRRGNVIPCSLHMNIRRIRDDKMAFDQRNKEKCENGETLIKLHNEHVLQNVCGIHRILHREFKEFI